MSPSHGGLSGIVEGVLEDAENGFSMVFRQALSTSWQQLQRGIESINQYDLYLEKAVNGH